VIQFVCDTCSSIKRPDEVWILGLAAESVGLTAARREIALVSTWEGHHAVSPLAVHFCSVRCKDTYMERLFGGDAAKNLVLETNARPRPRATRGKSSKARGEKTLA